MSSGLAAMDKNINWKKVKVDSAGAVGENEWTWKKLHEDKMSVQLEIAF